MFYFLKLKFDQVWHSSKHADLGNDADGASSQILKLFSFSSYRKALFQFNIKINVHIIVQ